ncbi:MAG: hypothetical protein WDO14_24315 [Bacteroidota bacterium]
MKFEIERKFVKVNRIKDYLLGLTGILALIVDAISLINYFISPSIQTPNLNLLLFVVTIYGWLVLSWAAVRHSFSTAIINGRVQRRFPVLRYATMGVGLVTGLFNLALSYATGELFILLHAAAWPIVYGILYLLLPVVYEEMRPFILRRGVYECRTDLWTVCDDGFDSILILAGEKITVISSHRSGYELIPSFYFVMCRHQKGLVKYYDLYNRFRLAKGGAAANT